MSSVQFSRVLNVQYKTAWVMAHKLREALGAEVQNTELNGEVEIDGAYFGGHIKPANEKVNRVDRRKKEHQTGLRRVVIALRERKGRTLTFIRKSEQEGVEIANEVVDQDAMMFADEATHWDALDDTFECGRINHSERYSEMNGKHTNWVESYFSRLRRMVQGQHHFVSPKYLHQYATHAAWCEDHRLEDNKVLTFRALRSALFSPVSGNLKGYWQKVT